MLDIFLYIYNITTAAPQLLKRGRGLQLTGARST